MSFVLGPGEVEVERNDGVNYRGMFDEDVGHVVFTNRRLAHVTNPWYLHPNRRGTALLYWIAWLFGYKPYILTYEVDLNHIVGLQFQSHMFTTGYRIRDVYGREVELHLGWQSVAEPWRDRLLQLIHTTDPTAQILNHGETIVIQRQPRG